MSFRVCAIISPLSSTILMPSSTSEIETPKLPAFILIPPPTVPGIQYSFSSPASPFCALSFMNIFNNVPPETSTIGLSFILLNLAQCILVVLINASLSPVSFTIILVTFPMKRYLMCSFFRIANTLIRSFSHEG